MSHRNHGNHRNLLLFHTDLTDLTDFFWGGATLEIIQKSYSKLIRLFFLVICPERFSYNFQNNFFIILSEATLLIPLPWGGGRLLLNHDLELSARACSRSIKHEQALLYAHLITTLRTCPSAVFTMFRPFCRLLIRRPSMV